MARCYAGLGLVLAAALAFQAAGRGVLAQPCPCTDVAPPVPAGSPTWTCSQQKLWGKCNTQWMIDSHFCEITCNRCTCPPALSSLPALPPPPPTLPAPADSPVPLPAAGAVPTAGAVPVATLDPVSPVGHTMSPEGCYVTGSVLDFLQTDPQRRFLVLTRVLQLPDLGVLPLVAPGGPKQTLFAPTDAAWESSLAQWGLAITDLVERPGLLKQILLAHLLPTGFSANAMALAMSLDTMLLGSQVLVQSSADGTMVVSTQQSRGTVTDKDLWLCQGSYVNVLDSVLLPVKLDNATPVTAVQMVTACHSASIADALRGNPSLSTVAGMVASGDVSQLQQILSGVTLVAPTDAAFAAMQALPAASGSLAAPGSAVPAATPTGLSPAPLQDPATLHRMLRYWTLPGIRRPSSFRDGQTLHTLLPSGYLQVSLPASSEGVLLDSRKQAAHVLAAAVQHDVLCGASILVVDAVPLPPPTTQDVLPLATAGQDTTPTAAPGAAPSSTAAQQPGCRDVRTVIQSLGYASQYLSAADAAGAGFLFDPVAPVTLFIPEDLALSRFRSEVGLSPIAFLQSATTAVSVIAYAEVPSQMLRTSDMQDGQALKTLVVSAGKPLELTLQVQGGAVTVAGVGSQARITHANIAACNAMIHIVDNILLPFKLGVASSAPPPPTPAPPIATYPSIPLPPASSLAQLGAVAVPSTVPALVPPASAAGLPQPTAAPSITPAQASGTAGDVTGARPGPGGTVIVPPAGVDPLPAPSPTAATPAATVGTAVTPVTTSVPGTPSPPPAAPGHSPACQTVLQIAEQVPQLSTFVSWAKSTGVADLWNDPRAETTVFMPPDDALQASLADMSSSNGAVAFDPALLRLLLLFHMLEGADNTTQLLAMKQSATLLGSREDVLRFQGKPGNVTVIDMVNDGGSKVLVSDVPACKSILNVISLPLLPSSNKFMEVKKELSKDPGSGMVAAALPGPVDNMPSQAPPQTPASTAQPPPSPSPAADPAADASGLLRSATAPTPSGAGLPTGLPRAGAAPATAPVAPGVASAASATPAPAPPGRSLLSLITLFLWPTPQAA